jgi:hypothetical protein
MASQPDGLLEKCSGAETTTNLFCDIQSMLHLFQSQLLDSQRVTSRANDVEGSTGEFIEGTATGLLLVYCANLLLFFARGALPRSDTAPNEYSRI